MIRRKRHQHEYNWRWEPQGVAWYGEWLCECGDVPLALTARDDDELNATLTRAFRSGAIDALGYYSAPTSIPYPS
jgi:hypothetical protein